MRAGLILRLLLLRNLPVALALALAACAQQPPPPPTPPALPALAVAPADYAATLLLSQRLSVLQAPRRADEPPSERQLDTLLQVDARQLRLVALALGQRVLTLAWDGRTLSVQRHPLLPAQVDAARVLRDIALVFAPLAALRQTLPPGWTLDEVDGERQLRWGEQLWLSARPLNGRQQVDIDNRAEHYRLRIESREASE